MYELWMPLASLSFLCHYASGHPSNPRKTTRWATEGAQGRARHTPVCGFAILFIAFQAFQATCVIPVAALCWSWTLRNCKTTQFQFFLLRLQKTTLVSFPAKSDYTMSCIELLRVFTSRDGPTSTPLLPHFYCMPLRIVMF